MQGKDLYRALSLAHGESCERLSQMWDNENRAARARCERVASVLEQAELPYSGALLHAIYLLLEAPDGKPFHLLSKEARALYTRAAQLLTCEQALTRFCVVLAQVSRQRNVHQHQQSDHERTGGIL